RTYIRAFAAMDQNSRIATFEIEQFKAVYQYLPGWPVQLNTLTSVLIQRLSISFQSGIHGRNLFDFAAERSKCPFKLILRDGFRIGRLLKNYVPGQITGIRFLAQAQRRFINLIGLEHGCGNLGSLPQTAYQQPGSERVKRAGLTSLASIRRTFGPLQGSIPRQALGFVEHQDTIAHLPASGSHRQISLVSSNDSPFRTARRGPRARRARMRNSFGDGSLRR